MYMSMRKKHSPKKLTLSHIGYDSNSKPQDRTAAIKKAVDNYGYGAVRDVLGSGATVGKQRKADLSALRYHVHKLNYRTNVMLGPKRK